MKKTLYAVLVAAPLVAGSAYALEIDCPPEPAGLQAMAGQGGDAVIMDEEMLKKRKQAREAELARLKARYMARAGSDAKVEPSEQDRTGH